MAAGVQRRDQILEDLLKKDNLNQALKHLNKKLKKHPKSIQNLISKAQVLQRMEDNVAAAQICDELAKFTPAIVDSDNLFEIHQLLHLLEQNSKGNYKDKVLTLWKNAIKAQVTAATKVVVAKEWAQNAIMFSQWSQVQQAAQTAFRELPESDPEKRMFFFWQIVALFLSGRSNPDPKMRQIQTGLASRMADQSLTDIPGADSPPGSTTGKWITTRSEFELYVAVAMFVDSAKATRSLEAKGLGPSSVDAHDKWGAPGWNSDLLVAAEDAPGVRKLAWAVMQRAQESKSEWKQSDWRLWKNLAHGFTAGEEAGTFDDIIQLAESAIQSDTGARSARLMIMLLLEYRMATRRQAAEEPEDSPHLVKYLEVFREHVKALIISPVFENDASLHIRVWSTHASKCASRIREIASEVVIDLSHSTAPSPSLQLKWITAEANVLSLDLTCYEAGFGGGESIEAESIEPLGKFNPHVEATAIHSNLSLYIASCIKLYKVARVHTARLPETDPDPGDRALILAAKALSWESVISRQQRFRILAACLLQFLVQESEHNSKARMMLVVRLQALGLHSLAAAAYKRLGVKGVLYESCAPIIFARLAVLHPMPSPDFKPLEELEKGLKFYADSLRALGDYQGLAMEEQNYSSAINMHVFQKGLQDSLVRRLLHLQRKRISRITGVPIREDDLLLDPFAMRPMERADVERYEFQHVLSPSTSMDVPLNCGMPANISSLAFMELLDEMLDLIRNGPRHPIGTLKIFQHGQMPLYALRENDKRRPLSHLGATESFWLTLTYHLSYLAKDHYSPEATLAGMLDKIRDVKAGLTLDWEGSPFSIIETWKKLVEDGRSYLPPWQLFEACYTRFDILKGVVTLCAKIQPTLKERFKKERASSRQEMQDALKELESLASALHRESRAVIQKARNRLSALADLRGKESLDFMMQPVDTGETESNWINSLRALHKEAFELMGLDNASRIWRSFIQSSIESCDSFLQLPEDMSKAASTG